MLSACPTSLFITLKILSSVVKTQAYDGVCISAKRQKGTKKILSKLFQSCTCFIEEEKIRELCGVSK